MSFIIECSKCGAKQEFTSKSKNYEENISIDVNVKGTVIGDTVQGIEIYCQNFNCNNSIEIGGK